jgi:hypothetical protein
MPDSTSSAAGSLLSDQTIDTRDYPEAYGTSPRRFRVWFDHIYDWFGATLDRVLPRYLVSAAIGVAVFLLGLLVAFVASIISLLLTHPGGLTLDLVGQPVAIYLKEPTPYIFSLDMAYALHVMRWLSQTYHERTNRLRACFTIGDREYRNLVVARAKYAIDPRRMQLALVFVLVIAVYFVLYTFGSSPLRNVLDVFYPHAVPLTWRGTYGIPTLCVVLLFASMIVLVTFTALHLTNTLRYLSRDLQDLAKAHPEQVQPLPSLIEDRFDGVLDLSLTGVLQFAGGIVLLEWVYHARLDLVGVVFVAATITQGLLLFIAPRRAANAIVAIARNRLFLQLISKEGAERQPISTRGELLDLATISWDDLSDRSEAMRGEIATRGTTISLLGILGLLASWALSVVLPVFNALNLDRLAIETIGQWIQRLLPFQ